MNSIDESVRDHLIAITQSPEFADAIARAILSRSDAHHDPDAWARSVLPLLKEYTAKLESIEFIEPADQQYFNTLQPTARNLAQFVSQRMSNAKDDVLRLELQLRLAEFEAALRQAANPNHRRKLESPSRR